MGMTTSFDEFFTPQHLSTTISMGRAVSRSPFTCSFKMKRNLRGQPKCQLSAVCLTSTILTARRQLSWPVEAGDEFNPLLA